MGLTFDSLIVLDRIEQFKKIWLVGIIGTCPQSVIEKIEELLQKIKEDGAIVHTPDKLTNLRRYKSTTLYI